MKVALGILAAILGFISIPQVSDALTVIVAANPKVATYAVPVLGFLLYLAKSPLGKPPAA